MAMEPPDAYTDQQRGRLANEEVAATGRWLRHLTEAEIAAAASALRIVEGKPLLELTRADVPLGALAAVLEEVTHELELGTGFKTLRGLPAARFSAEDNRRLF
jgi:hypothetical protein